MVQYQGYTKSPIPTLCFHIENPAVVLGTYIPFWSLKSQVCVQKIYSEFFRFLSFGEFSVATPPGV